LPEFAGSSILIAMRHLAMVVVCLCACLGTTGEAWGWSIKEHVLLTRLAAARLIADPSTPPEMKAWLQRGIGGPVPTMAEEREFYMHKRVGVFPRGVDGLPFWATYPDLNGMSGGDRKIEPFGVTEQKLHFVDVEFFNADPVKQTYADDLSARPKPSDLPRDRKDDRYQRAGMLPFAVEHAYAQMVKAIREGRLEDRPGLKPRDEHAVRWAGVLAHYLEDNTQPHHATEDYQSKSYFRHATQDPRRAPNVHSDVEYKLVDDDFNDYLDLREEQWILLVKALDEVQDPTDPRDPWGSTLAVSLASYEALPLIGRAAVAAYPQAGPVGPGAWNAAAFFHHKGQYQGREMSVMEMKARQQAWAVKRVERMWRQAWGDATRTDKMGH
jgi:hypothetical protein